MATDDVQSQLSEAADGLLYLSETDAPLVPVESAATDAEAAARELAEADAAAPVETVSVDHFFRNAVVERETDTDEMRATAARFRKLVETIHRLLPDAKVVRVGEMNVTAIVLGQAADGHWVGLRTELVET